MSEFRLFRTRGTSELGDYELRFGENEEWEVEKHWSDVSYESVKGQSKSYIVEDVMDLESAKARAAFRQMPIHISFTDESVGS